MTALEQEKAAEVAKYKAAEEKSIKDLVSQRDLFTKDRERIDKEKSQLATQLDEKGKQVEETLKKKDVEIRKLTDRWEALETQAASS